ncbi:FMN-dependent NADH-azoreductase [Catellatospora sp. TT07R-123]|uniref:FMN-dependent NADH-azoreductase n=1 Tax=Catellatospora sp. TT07R-123 TaxID=2733863 RepID=UPI001B06A6CE|nr:NAD(P)H-dependent oxidoreductase [Catellatospora sp. TT07R-123]GHJ45570.1 FMN-dependent NADH-azoreductase [Catellatospora sp. TT07R-123]
MRLLHIVATPRGELSHSLRIANEFIGAVAAGDSAVEVDVLDLYRQDLPAVVGDNIEAKYSLMVGQPIDRGHAESWRQIESLIEHFLTADAYVVTAPMWNFGIPYALKYYIDCVVQPGYLFRYDETGSVVPMVTGKKMVCVTSRGADYSPGGYLHQLDFQEPYLRTVFGFVGITDVSFINAQPMDITPDLRESALAAALAQARELGGSFLPRTGVPA